MRVPTHHPAQRERLLRCLDPIEAAEDFDRLAGSEPRRGDHDLAPGWRSGAPLRPAAVLVPLVDRREGLTVLLTTRTPHLAQHAGQVSFPGGRVERGDRSPIDTALRETREEVGIREDLIEPAGLLTPYETVTGFLVIPVVGFVSDRVVPVVDPTEVAEAFEIPLEPILDEATFRRGESTFRGERRAYYFLADQPRFVWGATAGMLRDMAVRYRAVGGEPFSN